jgi:hypothetical protein
MGRRVGAIAFAVAALVVLLVPAPAGAATGPKVITYSVSGRGNVSSLEDFSAEAAQVYADLRGWSLGGSLRFDRVASGGDFTLWLTADGLMSTFGGSCDVVWSCRNGRNVVINEDRWLGATDTWHAAGKPLATYHEMVLNHETGHWLGFNHAHCSGPGQPAPVMQQQSMTLEGCLPNPWPLPSERATVAARRGVTIIQPGETIAPPSTTTTTKPPTTTTTSKAPTTTTTKPSTTATTSKATTTRPASISRAEATCLRRVPRGPLRPWTRCF